MPQKEFEKVVVTEPEAAVVDSAGGIHKVESESLEHRKGFQPRGKTLGGSSSINAMLYVRGHRWDYDHWSELGNEGWSYNEILPYFKKAEHNEMFDNDFHGQDGPLNVSKIRHENNPVKDFVKTASAYDKMNEIMDMLQMKGIKKKFKFDEEFPPKIIIKAFEPLLYFYIVAEYSMRPHNKRLSYRNLVQYKLLQFSNENASFGRKIKKSTRNFNFKNFQSKIKWEDSFSEDFKPIKI